MSQMTLNGKLLERRYGLISGKEENGAEPGFERVPVFITIGIRIKEDRNRRK